MDAFSDFLAGPRARSAFLLRAQLQPPWSLLVRDEAPLTVVAVTSGEAWHRAEGVAARRLEAGDVAILRGSRPYVIADGPDTATTAIIEPGNRCTTVSGEPLATSMSLGVRTWGNSSDGHTVMLIGTYASTGELGRRLLDALPECVLVRPEQGVSATVGLLAQQIARQEPGQQVVLDRLLDLVLIESLRAAFAEDATMTPGWYRAGSDPLIGPVLQEMTQDLAQQRTVAGLAAQAGASRAMFSRRFLEVVGQPPMAFLTSWRMAAAADLLSEPGARVSVVARQVGYSSPFTFSAAFKRAQGMSPRDYRDQLQQTAQSPATGVR